MALEEDQEGTPLAANTKASPSPKEAGLVVVSQTSSCQVDNQKEISPAKKPPSPKDFILSVAHKFSSQPLQNSDPNGWGVLTAISDKARKRPQGINILLTADEHRIGRLMEDARYRIESNAVSGSHCTIYRKKISVEDVDEQISRFSVQVFLKDTSTNGTYLNWERLKKNGSEAKLKHGDIVSFAAAPQHEAAYAFVYREVLNTTSAVDGAVLKRKAGEFVSENKRLKGIGIGAPEGPVSLDDVRSLQRSNTELRKELESHVLTIEIMQNENRSALARHESELKELRESVSKSYLDEVKELQRTLETNQKELVEVTTLSAERQEAIVDLNERLNASLQSRIDKDEIINSQKATISELENQLDEERKQRTVDREKALVDHKAALQRAHSEAQEELKRQSDVASQQERELKEVINKLQESDKESRTLVEALRTKLEDTRESLVISEKKVRQLEAQFQEEQQISANERKKVETLENEMRRLRKELQNEKVAREEAWAKVSALELEMATAIRDLSVEKQRFQGARERIILRETQLRAFYSTTEEISSLFAKQQEQLKAMQRTLEDEENYENMSVDNDINEARDKTDEDFVRENAVIHRGNNNLKESSAASTPKVDRMHAENSSDEASVTEKHDCEVRSQEGHNTQDLECASADRSVKGAFGSDIDGIGTAPEIEGDPIETERVLGTESPGTDKNIDLNKLGGDTMQLDDEVRVHESEGVQKIGEESGHGSQTNNPLFKSQNAMEDTEGAGTIRTADLLTSEVAGSWAISTAPSVAGENESPTSGDRDGAGNYDEAAPLLFSSDGQATGSQIVPNTPAASKMSLEREALNEFIEIVAPGSLQQFGNGNDSARVGDHASSSGSDTEEGNDHEEEVNKSDAEGGSMSDADDTQAGSDQGEDNEIDETEDSVG